MLQPTKSSDRIIVLDALRGFALLGILIVNWMIVSWSQLPSAAINQKIWFGSLNEGTIWLIHFLFEYKFFSLFSFLFGLGFAMQYNKSVQQKTPFVPFYIRRQIILLGIGIIHSLLLWSGDFLVLYAIQGLLLLLFRKAEASTILIWAIIIFSIPIILSTAFYFFANSSTENLLVLQNELNYNIKPDLINLIDKSNSIYPNGNYYEILQLRLNEIGRFYSSMFFWWWNSFAMFLVGLYAGKKEYMTKVTKSLKNIKNWWIISAFIGSTTSYLFVLCSSNQNLFVPTIYNLYTALLYPISVVSLVLFIITSFILLSNYKLGDHIINVIAPMGKIALTNYILQSLICNLLLYGFGTGLYGIINPFLGIILCIIIWFLQLLCSNWYISKFSFGPIEFIWRKLTYK